MNIKVTSGERTLRKLERSRVANARQWVAVKNSK